MAHSLADYRLFWKQFRRHYHTTGAIAPSGRALGLALARYVQAGEPDDRPRRVLEVGPGTGAVTTQIVAALGPSDRLDMVELNDEFARRLRERFETEAPFRSVAARARVLHQRVEALAGEEPYDLVISGLPLNNFAADQVEQILAVFERLLRPGGTLSFFQYIGIRAARAAASGRAERARLRGVGAALERVLALHEIRRDCVWTNLPPAWVHHVRWG